MSAPITDIALGSDHAGFHLKEAVASHLRGKGFTVLNLGAFNDERSDYPQFVIPAAEAVRDGQAQAAIVFGGSGNGEAIAANKVRGIRCAVCWAPELGALARQHNNANAISLPARFITEDVALRIVDVYLAARYEGGRHEERLELIARYEALL